MFALFGVSLALRLAFAAGFNGLYGQDAYAYYKAAADLHAGAALQPFFWPLGYPALLALGFAVFGAAPLTAQAISLALGAALAPLTYVLARQIGAEARGALAAGLLLAVCGQAVQSSIVVMADVPALAWATLSAILLLRALRTGAARWLMLSALLLALAGVTRWLYLALIPAWGAALLAAGRTWGWRRLARLSLLAAGAAAPVLLPQIAVSLHSPFPVLNHAWVTSWSPANAFARSFTNVDGHFDYAQTNAQFYARVYVDPYFLAPIFTPLALLGVWALRRRRALLLLLALWALLPYLFLAGIPYQNTRFPLIVMPALAALVGLGLQTALHRRPLTHRLASAALIAGGLAWSLSASQPVIAAFVAHQQTDQRAVQWARARVPAAARLYTFELTQPLAADAPFAVRELYDETPERLAGELADGVESFLFANIWVIEHQWADRPLDATYRWLRDTVGLDYLDRVGNYWLFRIHAVKQDAQ